RGVTEPAADAGILLRQGRCARQAQHGHRDRQSTKVPHHPLPPSQGFSVGIELVQSVNDSKGATGTTLQTTVGYLSICNSRSSECLRPSVIRLDAGPWTRSESLQPQ